MFLWMVMKIVTEQASVIAQTTNAPVGAFGKSLTGSDIGRDPPRHDRN